ncbi:MAG: hypothetical protein LBM96_12675 [Methanobrevibacter sp.]|jgi:hypothetical protein|nr:hypothetical protein [Candidatus Methanoflexus mossambicus]
MKNFKTAFNLNVDNGSVFYASTDAYLCFGGRIFVENIVPDQDEEDGIDDLIDRGDIKYRDYAHKEIFVYPTLNDDGRIIIDFRDNNFNDISLSIKDEKDKIMYTMKKIPESKFYIDLSDFNYGEYLLQIDNNETKEPLLYNLKIIE